MRALAVTWVGLTTLLAAPLWAQETGIFVMRVDGSQERKVVQVDGFTAHGSPRWSHDGKRLAFDAYDAWNFQGKSFVVNLDGSKLTEIGPRGSLDWSPDDKQFVFHIDRGGLEPGVWVQNVSGSGQERLTAGAWPRWSPDGSKIAFCDETTLRMLDVASGEEGPIVEESFEQRPGSFEWSRDGTRIAFITRRAQAPMRELFIVKADGTNQVLKPRLARPGNFGGHVTWSPNDKQLAFTIDSFIYVLDVAGNADPRRVGGQPDKSRDPEWSPDGEWFAFARRPR